MRKIGWSLPLLLIFSLFFGCKTNLKEKINTSELNSSAAPLVKCPSYLASYEFECEVYKRYNTLKRLFRSRFNVNIDNINYYRSLRLIGDYRWLKTNYNQKRKSKNKLFPWEELSGAKFYPWDVYRPKPETWMVWERGAHYLKGIISNNEKLINSGKPLVFNLDDLKNINRSVIDKSLMKETARLKGGEPGLLRKARGYGVVVDTIANTVLYTGFPVKCDDWNNPNQKLVEYLKNYDFLGKDGLPLVRANLTECESAANKVTMGSIPNENEGKYEGNVFYTKDARVEKEIEYWDKEMVKEWNTYFINSKRIEKSPLSFIADIQKWFISIHPFRDGNGRTSRLIQGMIAKSFGLPFIPSGKLGNDIYAMREEYRSQTKKAVGELVDFLGYCYDEYSQFEYHEIDSINKNCRELYSSNVRDRAIDQGSLNEIKTFNLKLQEYLRVQKFKPIYN